MDVTAREGKQGPEDGGHDGRVALADCVYYERLSLGRLGQLLTNFSDRHILLDDELRLRLEDGHSAVEVDHGTSIDGRLSASLNTRPQGLLLGVGTCRTY